LIFPFTFSSPTFNYFSASLADNFSQPHLRSTEPTPARRGAPHAGARDNGSIIHPNVQFVAPARRLVTMPALPGKTSPRKKATPRAKQEKEDVWERTFNIMGLEPLSSNKDKSTAMTTITDISSPSPAGPSLAQGSEKKTVSILDLPSETQKDIFRYVSAACACASD
jgi:hypothetical protein